MTAARSRLAGLALGLVIALGVVAGRSVTGGAGHPAATAAAELPASLTITAPATVAAGSTVTVEVAVDRPDNRDNQDGLEIRKDSVEVVAVAGHRSVRLEATIDGGRAVLELGPAVTDRVGVVSLLAATSTGATHATFTVTAGPAAEIDPLAGPRTIVADGADETMVVTVPVDALGNPLPDGTEVTIGVLGPDGVARDLAASTDTGIAAVRFPSTTLAGPVTIAASSGAARGPAVGIDQVAGRPAAFTLIVPHAEADRPLVADGRSLHRLVTTDLVDEHGNVLPDGVSVDVRVDTPLGSGRLTAVVIAGRAEIQFEAPPAPGPVTVTATIDGVTGSPIMLGFGAALDTVPVRIDRHDDSLTVLVGPVLDGHGAYVPDGTVAELTGAAGTPIRTLTIQDGVAEATVELGPDDGVSDAASPIEVTVLGTTVSVAVPDDPSGLEEAPA